jgi:hypothetical protein
MSILPPTVLRQYSRTGPRRGGFKEALTNLSLGLTACIMPGLALTAVVASPSRPESVQTMRRPTHIPAKKTVGTDTIHMHLSRSSTEMYEKSAS